MTETDAQLIRETIQIIEAHYLMTFGEIRVEALRRAAARTPDDMQGWLEHRAAQRGLTIDELREYDLLLTAKQKLPEDFNDPSEKS